MYGTRSRVHRRGTLPFPAPTLSPQHTLGSEGESHRRRTRPLPPICGGAGEPAWLPALPARAVRVHERMLRGAASAAALLAGCRQ